MKRTKIQVNKTVLIMGCLLLSACGDITFSGEGRDVPTAGEISIAVDYGDSFMVNEELEMFHINYPKATITPKYLCENEILRKLESDSIQCAILNRDFTKAEKQNLEKLNIKVRSYEIGRTAIALIVAANSEMQEIGLDDLKLLLAGKASGSLGKTEKLVFDESCGSNLLYFSQKWFNGKTPPGNLVQKSGPREVIRYVSKTENVIGFVNMNWLGDRMDAESKNLADQIKVLKVENPEKKGYYLPFQSQIAANQYPIVQRIFMHDLQGYSGLAQGFIAFVASQPGQLILKKSGLLPSHDMGRTIELVEE